MNLQLPKPEFRTNTHNPAESFRVIAAYHYPVTDWQAGTEFMVLNLAVHGCVGPADSIPDISPALVEQFQQAHALISASPGLLEAACCILHDIDAMVAGADRGEVWRVNVGTRARIDALRAIIAKAKGVSHA